MGISETVLATHIRSVEYLLSEREKKKNFKRKQMILNSSLFITHIEDGFKRGHYSMQLLDGFVVLIVISFIYFYASVKSSESFISDF